MRIYSGPEQITSPTSMLVKRWVRLVDLNGNGQTVWYEAGSAWASSSAPATFTPFYVNRRIWRTASRIQSYYAGYIGGVFKKDLYLTTTAYTKWVLIPVFGGGSSWQQSASGNSCYF
jgi:hypothetical protein